MEYSDIDDMYICKRMVRIIKSGGSRDIEVNLTFAELKKVLKTKKCFFTGVVLDYEENSPNQLTVDRLDNDKGYVNGNIVACSKEFNEIKGNITLKNIEILYTKLKSKKLL